MFPIEQHTIFLSLAGSHAHGTARDGSDVDLRGVCIAPLRMRLSLFRSFEQYEGNLPEALAGAVLPRIQAHPTASRALHVKTECVIFDVAKFVGLCAAANPNALEILFADERDWLFETRAWRHLYDARHSFLTKKVKESFIGYAMAQLKRIETHRSWLLNPPTKKPTREDFGLAVAGGTVSRDDQDRAEQAVAEKRYRAAMKQWEAYQAWKAHRNPARAELERKHGYDTKHAMHLVRLLRMGREVLESGEVRVRRDDAEELAAIRDGAMSFEELLETATLLKEAIDAAAARTTLPDDVDREQVDALVFELVMGACRETEPNP